MLAAAHIAVFAGEMTAEVVKKKLAEKAVEAVAHQADKVPKLHAFRLTAEAKYRAGERVMTGMVADLVRKFEKKDVEVCAAASSLAGRTEGRESVAGDVAEIEDLDIGELPARHGGAPTGPTGSQQIPTTGDDSAVDSLGRPLFGAHQVATLRDISPWAHTMSALGERLDRNESELMWVRVGEDAASHWVLVAMNEVIGGTEGHRMVSSLSLMQEDDEFDLVDEQITHALHVERG